MCVRARLSVSVCVCVCYVFYVCVCASVSVLRRCRHELQQQLVTEAEASQIVKERAHMIASGSVGSKATGATLGSTTCVCLLCAGPYRWWVFRLSLRCVVQPSGGSQWHRRRCIS